MDALKKALGRPTANFVDSPKLYYNFYPYRVQVALALVETTQDNKKPALLEAYLNEQSHWKRIRNAEYVGVRNWIVARRKEALSITRKRGLSKVVGKVKLRNEQQTMSAFFERKEDAARYIRANRNCVIEVSGPRSEGDIAFMKINPKSRIRSRLYWNKYRYCVLFKWIPKENREALQSWFESYLDHAEGNERENRFLYSYTLPVKVYVAEESDLQYIRIAWSECIASIEKAILKEEVDAQPAAAHEAD